MPCAQQPNWDTEAVYCGQCGMTHRPGACGDAFQADSSILKRYNFGIQDGKRDGKDFGPGVVIAVYAYTYAAALEFVNHVGERHTSIASGIRHQAPQPGSDYVAFYMNERAITPEDSNKVIAAEEDCERRTL